MAIRHLPYQIDEQRNRFHFYETLWKKRGIELLVRHCPQTGKSLLDYGCGRGECLAIAAKSGFQAQGTDVDPKCVELSGAFGPACVLNPADPVSQFGPKSFDVVTCFHVLEHVENPKQTLSAISRIAREYVVLAVPNLRYLHCLFKRRIVLDIVNDGHLQSWDHWHFLNLAERHCDLKLIEWGNDATILPVLSGLSQRILGTKATTWLETGPFKRAFPFHGISVLGLFRPGAGQKNSGTEK